PYYSFDRNGCHFIGWDSATPQDPRPSFGEEGFTWLREDLKRVSRETPIFLYCHHPIDSGELASLYERDRLLDMLRPYNLALILVGHGHAPQHRVIGGVDQVMGGSTFGNAPGYSVVSVRDGVLRVVYRRAIDDAPARPLLERPLPARSRYPRIEVRSPVDGETARGTVLTLRARIDLPGVQSARWDADDEKTRSGELRPAGDAWQADIDTREWEPGCHYLRVTFRTEQGQEFQRTLRFYTAEPGRVLWRAFMEGSGKGAPLVSGNLVLAGGGDGLLYAFDRKSGRKRWTFRTGGEILAQPVAVDGGYCVGSGDGKFYCVDPTGKQRWSFTVGHPAYSTAAVVGGKVVFAANNGHIYALDPKTGAKVWECTAPGYSIESRPWVSGATLYYGAWDGYVYAIDAEDGSVRWRAQGAGAAASAPGVARYYSPADAGPVEAGGRLWIADRAFKLTLLDAANGSVLESREKISSVARSQDGSAVYLRGTDGNLRKVDLQGKELWSAPALTSIVPSAPAERDGVVYSASPTGRILALDARDGRKLWDCQATPRLYVFSEPVAAGGAVYVTGMDGSLTALRAR
ncbi:MAG TPA: PQQ-binding-like beta-propeller repeat protein, partial [Armatimonadota bacterium]|nr:PQQ-binding-like beta-propeller repeat protein [Armatimonadota bacterium]